MPPPPLSISSPPPFRAPQELQTNGDRFCDAVENRPPVAYSSVLLSLERQYAVCSLKE